MDYSHNKENNVEAAAIRFQRGSIAFLSIITVVINSPTLAYLILLTSIIAIISLKAEPLNLFYKKAIRKILSRDIFSFAHIFPGSFLLDSETERFIFMIIAMFQGLGIVLFHAGVDLWFIPIAVVAAGTTLSATTGICLMGFMYAMAKERRKKDRPSNSSSTSYRNKHCIVQRNLGVPLYHRCTSCTSRGLECLGMQFNLTAGTTILLLLIMLRFGYMQHVISLAIITAFQLRLGTLVNRKTDDLFADHHSLDIRNRELSILLDATTDITSELDLERTLSVLAKRIVGAVDCTFAKILLTDKEREIAIVKAAHSIRHLEWDPALPHLLKIQPDSYFYQVLFQRSSNPINQEFVMIGPDQVKEFYKNEAFARSLLGNLEKVQSLCILPVCVHDQCFGAVVLGETGRSKRDSFTQQKLNLAMSLVRHAGIAIKNSQHYELLAQTHLGTTIGLAEALETRDASTRNHSDRTVEYAKAIARELGLTPEQQEQLQYAAILHDIGKIGVPDNILNKPGKLTDEEFAIMKTHSAKGANIISKIPFLASIAPMICHHHERWDGKGYPNGLAGEDIPIESRIVAVLDSYDAMTADRVYRQAMDVDYAIGELRKCSGTQFDPKVVNAFLKIIGTAKETKHTHTNKKVG